jgi:hypothetical protein
MARLIRLSDKKGESGSRVDAIEWDENGKFKEVKGHEPIIGCSLLVGSVTARSYSDTDYWLTTPITEILERKKDEKSLYVKFKTENSVYEFFS